MSYQHFPGVGVVHLNLARPARVVPGPERHQWDAKPGSRTVAARVISGDGETQTATAANPFPGGSSGIQSFLVTVE